ncbi:glutamate-5-semialdehyde dehydrogenase [Helicobacter sp. MIT 21-1697]|uniref:glutamate-5-semialdehyde dehydrogenase n=1 Tax=Helicobacter sp. MIT 21-1697 TaxID=2993733 RepID=UPI00224A9442|nr:glutamate-5-semialdehyde dehydrogenase [Helicobacter sp. MIT 21-1697]MCX2716997.1 glutamate-5-semialdehyde dehydrogenase [Helicobacter sp. MIT 21-1697]
MQDIEVMLISAKRSARILERLSDEQRNAVLESMADRIESQSKIICEANARDISAAQNLPLAMRKRLELNSAKVRFMADSIRDIAKLPCTTGQVIKSWKNKAGLEIAQVSVPLGVIGVIYESRPNVTSDVSALCFKSGNVCVLKGGKEAFYSNMAILQALHSALEQHSLPKECISMIEDTSREGILEFVKMDKYVDLLIPRGGEGLIEFVKHNATIPIIKHDKGVCHTYIHEKAQQDKAQEIVLNAKLSYPAACNACECVILDEVLVEQFLPTLLQKLRESGVRVMFENEEWLKNWGVADDGLADFNKEWGDKILNLKVVSGINEALEHIAHYGSSHSECIITQDEQVAQIFMRAVDAACVYWNASTRFSDGGEFGFGAEVGISTSKIHARGPMGIESLRSYKYCITGNGQVR